MRAADSVGAAALQAQGERAGRRQWGERPGQRVGAQAAEAGGRHPGEAVDVRRVNALAEDHLDAGDLPRQVLGRPRGDRGRVAYQAVALLAEQHQEVGHLRGHGVDNDVGISASEPAVPGVGRVSTAALLLASTMVPPLSARAVMEFSSSRLLVWPAATV